MQTGSDAFRPSKRPPRSSKRIIVIYEGKSEEYASISEASRSTGISRQRIIRALKRRDGFIPACPFCVDFSLPPSCLDGGKDALHGIEDEKIDELHKKAAYES